MPSSLQPPGVPRLSACSAYAAGLLFVSTLVGCSSQEAPPPPPPPTVVVQTPDVRDVTSYYRYTGNMAAVEAVEVRARVTGELMSQHFTASTDVEKGDLLFVIEPAPYEAEVAAAQANLEQTQAALELAEIEKQRIDDAFEKQAATERERLQADATVKQRQAEVAAAQAGLDDANIRLGYTQVQSPIAGRVDRNLVDVGNLVNGSEGTLLTTVTQLDPIHAYFDVSERIVLEYLERGRNGGVGQEAEPPPLELARASDDKGQFPFTGVVNFVAPRVDNQTGTIQVRGIFENDNAQLFPGLFVRVRAPYEIIEDALVIPEGAVGKDLSGDFVMVVGEGEVAERRGLTLGEANDDGTVTVLEGLDASDRVIVEGIQKARPGSPVTIKTNSPAATPSPPAAAEPSAEPEAKPEPEPEAQPTPEAEN